MQKKKITMLDIATAVGVSQPTVSVILNGSTSVKVSKTTHDKVIAKAKELGYRFKTNILHTNHHCRIAMLVNSLNMHDPFVNAISAAKVRAWEFDQLLVVFDYEDNEQLKLAMINEIQGGHYSGLIFASNTPQVLSSPAVVNLPLVYLNCETTEKHLTTPTIVASDFIGGYRATEHLVNKGYRNIAMITGETWSESSIRRENGYYQALLNADIPVNKALIVNGNWSVKQSYTEMKHLLQSNLQFDAVFCASDLMALGCYQAVAEKQLNIPKDIAVIGYDNQLLANEITPSLSSIDLPYDEMGRRAIEILNDYQSQQLMLIKMEGEVYPREST